MKKILLLVSLVALASCATIFNGSKTRVTLSNDNVTEPVDLTVDGRKFYGVTLPCKVKIRRGFRSSEVLAEAEGYEPGRLVIRKRFNTTSVVNLFNVLAWGIDAATGAMMKPEQKYYQLPMRRISSNYVELPGEEGREDRDMVSRDAPGQTDLERTVIRWFFDSDPRGARIYWRVVSSIPAVVKNTNETYLMTTPFEETRSFNILGLTYENSRDVQIEIKVSKRGYEDQVKRFNVRQAIDQQEISSFFEMVPKEE